MKIRVVFLFFLLEISINCFGQKSHYEEVVNEANWLYSKGRPMLAEEKYKLAISIDSTKVDAYYYLGRCYCSECNSVGKNCSLAINYLTKSIALDSSFNDPYYYRGRAQALLGHYSMALPDLNTSVRIHNDSGSYFTRAMIKIKLADVDGACEDFFNAGKLGSKIGENMFYLNCDPQSRKYINKIDKK